MKQNIYSRKYYAGNPKEAEQWFRNDNKSKGRTMQYKVVAVEKSRDGSYEVIFSQKRQTQNKGIVLRSLSGRRL